MVDYTIIVAVLACCLGFLYYTFFRADSNTKSTFNPTPGGTTAFKSVTVPGAVKKAVAPKISKKQRAKNEVFFYFSFFFFFFCFFLLSFRC
jgi:hypothetical protein